MPTLNSHCCPVPGCPNITTGGKCPQHLKAARKEYDSHRPAGWKRFNANWRRLREMVLARDPVCKNPFQIPNHLEFSTVADHIVPVAKGGAECDLDNLQGLCKSCHDRKTACEVGLGGSNVSRAK